MAGEAWKKAESWWVRALGALYPGIKDAVKRWPSQGTAHPDIEGPDFTIEHKERHSLPKWFLHALDQCEENRERQPDKAALIGMTYQRGRGYPAKRFIVVPIQDADHAAGVVERLIHGD